DERLRAAEPALYSGLERLRDRVRGNPESVRAIGALYSIKNTMGYGLNSFLDHDRPVDLLEHLVIGSEGTLAFVAEAVFRTVPVERLYATCVELIRLFERHGYEESVIFGHAKDGNIHFMLNERFDDPASLRRYEAFTEEMVELVLGQGGTLKAEHGTGRIMA